MPPPVTAGRAAVKLAFAVTLLALALFLPAGTWRWPGAWLFIGLYLAFAAPVGLWLLRANPDLLARRLDWAGRAPKKWDRALMAAYTPVYASVYVLAGLDFRCEWSDVPRVLRAVAFVPVGAFYVLLALVLRENAFLSRVVEVHPEAGHHVITTGPYAHVRHPMYAGYAVWLLATPVALGSVPALVPAGIVSVGMIVRTILEDRTLHAELPGYPEYAARVRWRLLPHVF
jgi:protein-S-isoprenylcysteine O-methyltransferase Ste14